MPLEAKGASAAPTSFAVELGEWDPWLLAHGLPPLPDVVGSGEAVPVAVWIGSRWAATLHLVEREPDEDDPGAEPSLDIEEQAFRRCGDGWVAAESTGGTSWWPDLGLRRPPVDGRYAAADGLGFYGGPDWLAGVVTGVAGAEAAAVQVVTAGGSETCPLTSPVGSWLAAFDARSGATVRVRDAAGIVLCERRVDPVGVG